jgi:hypothetical protein
VRHISPHRRPLGRYREQPGRASTGTLCTRLHLAPKRESARQESKSPRAREALEDPSNRFARSTPVAAPTPSGVVPTSPPRAQLVKLPTPRATLVALPQWHVGEQRRLLMPYGLEVVGRLRGHSEGELYLPTGGNAIGDTWLVENTPWIWLTVPGTSAPTWVVREHMNIPSLRDGEHPRLALWSIGHGWISSQLRRLYQRYAASAGRRNRILKREHYHHRVEIF